MATRSNIHFTDGDYLAANIYVHSDGYPEYRLPELQRFFHAVRSQCRDARFGDPSYLAAKFIVWYAEQQTLDRGLETLNFLGIGPMVGDAGDSEYIYEINCEKRDANRFPVVTYKNV